jgi:hypothetical protein
VDSLIEQPCLHCPGRHPFRDLSGSGGFASIIAGWLRYFFVPSPEKRLFPFHFGAMWFRRLPSAPGFALILSYCFAAVHLGFAGDIVGPQLGRVVSSVINVGRGPLPQGFSGERGGAGKPRGRGPRREGGEVVTLRASSGGWRSPKPAETYFVQASISARPNGVRMTKW